MKTKGLVFDSERSLVEPDELYDRSRYGHICTSKTPGSEPGWVRLPSGLWVMDFDASAPDYVEIPAAYTQLNFTSGDFSIIAGIKIDNLDDEREIFCRGASWVDGYRCFVKANAEIWFETNQAVSAQNSTTDVSNPVLVDTRYTVGFSRSGTSIRIYKDGVDATAVSGTHTDPVTCTRSAKIGIYDDKTQYPFDGKIAYLAIWNYALSATQHRKKHDALSGWM